MIVKHAKEYKWTYHAHAKMRQYGLSEQKMRSVIHSPKRIEKGIAPDTVAFLKSAGSAKHPHEIWVMVVEEKNERRIISAWRYPGVTKPGEPLPQAILSEMDSIL